MTLRYGAVVRSLRSLRGDPEIPTIAPSETFRYRDHARGCADVYLPRDPIGASVVLVHGGGFVIGSRRMKPMRYLATRLVEAGLAVCTFDYRMIFRGGRLAEATDDVVAAYDAWAKRAPDPRAITIAGLSAGGTLALLAAPRIEPARIASCFGLYELDHLRGPAALLPRMLWRSADRAAWIGPRHAPQTRAPVLLLHGADDGLVPVEQATRLAAHRTSLGLATRVVIYPDVPHGFFNLAIPAAASGAAELVAWAGS